MKTWKWLSLRQVPKCIHNYAKGLPFKGHLTHFSGEGANWYRSGRARRGPPKNFGHSTSLQRRLSSSLMMALWRSLWPFSDGSQTNAAAEFSFLHGGGAWAWRPFPLWDFGASSIANLPSGFLKLWQATIFGLARGGEHPLSSWNLPPHQRRGFVLTFDNCIFGKACCRGGVAIFVGQFTYHAITFWYKKAIFRPLINFFILQKGSFSPKELLGFCQRQ